jgi:uncharacterized Zn finger protein (UPF0148 family)
VKTMTYTGELVVTSCWCGIKVAIPNSLYRAAQADHDQHIFCPLGHKYVYGENEADRQRARAEEAERQAKFARQDRDWYQDRMVAERRSKAAMKGHLTRMRNRIANGVCPVSGCRRHFDNVQAHIRGQHPDWVEQHEIVLKGL